MGYWEQIGEANRKYERRRAAMHPLRRRLGEAIFDTFICAISITLWIVLLSPLWLLALR